MQLHVRQHQYVLLQSWAILLQSWANNESTAWEMAFIGFHCLSAALNSCMSMNWVCQNTAASRLLRFQLSPHDLRCFLVHMSPCTCTSMCIPTSTPKCTDHARTSPCDPVLIVTHVPKLCVLQHIRVQSAHCLAAFPKQDVTTAYMHS